MIAGPSGSSTGNDVGEKHLTQLTAALMALDLALLRDWGKRLAAVLQRGGRLPAAGNGGSAAHDLLSWGFGAMTSLLAGGRMPPADQ